MSKFIIAAAAAALVGSATVATADSYISFNEAESASSVLDLGNVTAASNGVVEIYDFNRGQAGALLGTEMVTAGANYDVRVNLGAVPVNDVVAILKVDGVIADQQEIDIQ